MKNPPGFLLGVSLAAVGVMMIMSRGPARGASLPLPPPSDPKAPPPGPPEPLRAGETAYGIPEYQETTTNARGYEPTGRQVLYAPAEQAPGRAMVDGEFADCAAFFAKAGPPTRYWKDHGQWEWESVHNGWIPSWHWNKCAAGATPRYV